MDWNKIAPWNWFKKEQEGSVPVAAPARRVDSLVAMRDDMDRLFEDAVRRFGAGSSLATGWPAVRALGDTPVMLRPDIDISEGRKSYTVRVEVPGVEKGDVTCEIDDDTLIIRGEKRQEKDETEEGYHCIERSYGHFQRTLSLPADADAESIDAKFKNGVLKINIPKREAPPNTGRTIDIQHA